MKEYKIINKFDLNFRDDQVKIEKVGRKRIFETPQDMIEACSNYFNHCEEKQEKPTITGLTMYIGFGGRSSWDDYKKRDGFEYVVNRAKLAVQHSYEMSGTTFDMFALKNMGWKDKQEVTNTNINTYTPTREDIQKAKEDLKDLDI